MTSPTTLHLLAVDHRDLPASARRPLAWDRDLVRSVLVGFADRHPGAGLAVVATCTRTELYVEAAADHPAMVHDVVSTLVEPGACPARQGLWYELEGDDVPSHLFRVAAGLESQILGDVQLAGQLRSAGEEARRAGTLTPLLAGLWARASALGRAVRRETAIADGGADIGTVAVADLVARLDPAARGPVVVLGQGQVGRSVTTALASAGVAPVVTLARSGAGDRPLTDLDQVLEGSAALIHTLPPSAGLLDDDLLDRAWTINADLLVVDLAAVSLDRADGRLIRLQDLVDHPTPRRLAAVPEVDRRCRQAVGEWRERTRRRPLEETIAALYRELAELDGAVAPEQRRLLRRILHHHVVRLRQLDFVLPTAPSPASVPVPAEPADQLS